MRAPVFLITGPQGAGKSTVANRLARRFLRGVHVEGDSFRRNIVAGGVDMTPEPTEEATTQLQLRYRLAAETADSYSTAGYAVAVEDVVAGASLALWPNLVRSRPFQIVVLLPSIEVVTERDALRDSSGYGLWSPRQLYEVFLNDTPRLGIWLDTSSQTPDETVDEILVASDLSRLIDE